jgi:hypothetical protein
VRRLAVLAVLAVVLLVVGVVAVDGSLVPAVVTDRVAAVAASVGDLPPGLVASSVRVTPEGVRLVATGADVDLEQA